MRRTHAIVFALALFTLHCGSSDSETPTTTDTGAATTDTGAATTDTGAATTDTGTATTDTGTLMPCVHDKSGERYDCQTCTANCQFLKDWCKDGTLVAACPTDKAVGTCKDADPVGIGTKLDVMYYTNATLTGGKPQCDIIKGTWTPK